MTLFATVLAAAVGAPATVVLTVAVAALAGQLSIGWSNDWIDAARDARVGRRDKPVAAGLVRAGTVRRAALLALAVCVVASLALGLAAGLLHLAAVGAAWAYNAGLKSSPLSWLPYAFSFGALPSVATFAVGTGPAPLWATAAGSLLGVGAHLANVLPDLADDAATGVRGLPHRIGFLPSALLAAALLLAATAVVVLGPPSAPHAWGWAGLGVATALTGLGVAHTLGRGASRLAFRTSIAVAAVDVGLLVAAGSALA